MSGTGWGVQVGVVVAGAFVVGIVVGGLSPRAQVRSLEDQVFELERQRARSGSASGRQFTELLTGGLAARGSDAKPSIDAAPPDAVGERPRDDGTPSPVGRPADEDEVDRNMPPEPTREESLQMAREALEVRSAQARAALMEDVRPTPDQVSQIDAAVADMNAELASMARDFVASVQDQGEPSRREMMMTGADVLDVMVDAETRILDALDADQRAAVREGSTDPTAYIDPSVIEIMSQIQDFGQ